jgi:hypothetical protein
MLRGIFPFCLVFGCPFQADIIKILQKRAVKAEEEVSRLRDRMIEEGLEVSASILSKGQR